MNVEYRSMNLDKLRIFYHAAMAKSFTNCGLNLSPSAISRHIADLEYWLKVKLFVRHPKGMTLTPEGEKLLETCHTVFKELEGIKEAISLDTLKAEGLLRITTPSGWISTILVRLIKSFLEDNPDVRLSIKSYDGVPDFSRSETDVALLPYMPDDPDLIGLKLMSLHLGMFASPEYLKEHGVPKSIDDLKDHRLISYGDHEHSLVNINWHLSLGMPAGQTHEPYLTINNLYYAAEEGFGIVTLAKENVLLRDNRLLPVLPEVTGPMIDACCVYPKRLEKSKRIQAFLHYMQQEAQIHKWH
jgi:DNA-binding transcriptional LysR family regulator